MRNFRGPAYEFYHINFSVSLSIHPDEGLVCVGTRDCLHFGSMHLKNSGFFFFYCNI